jgi:hypothetical protein
LAPVLLEHYPGIDPTLIQELYPSEIKALLDHVKRKARRARLQERIRRG